MDVGADLEGLARLLYAELGFEPDRPPGTKAIARAWRVPVERVHMAGQASTLRWEGVGDAKRPIIVVRPTVADAYLEFSIGHELGHLLVHRAGLALEDEEAAANYLAAALMMPRAAVLEVHGAEGFEPEALAELGRTTHTGAALRFAEVLGQPLAAVSPALVRYRGPESFVWPGDEPIRKMATARRLGPGIVRVKLKDQPQRFALLVDEDIAAG